VERRTAIIDGAMTVVEAAYIVGEIEITNQDSYVKECLPKARAAMKAGGGRIIAAADKATAVHALTNPLAPSIYHPRGWLKMPDSILEAVRDAGQMLDIRVLGLASIGEDVTPELARASIASLTVLGALHASAAVKAALQDRMQ
jgi:Ribbon-Helix-Helix transcriptional regulator family